MKTKLAIAALILSAFALGQSTRRYNIKVSHLGQSAVAVSCLNGADPTGKTFGGVLILSCEEIK